MRILLVDPGTVAGGAEVYAERLASLLRDDNEFFGLCCNGRLNERLRAHGARSHLLPLPGPRPITRIGKYGLLLAATSILLLRHKIDVLLLNGYQASYLAPVGRLFGCRTVITPHHLPPERRTRRWYRATARWADVAISVSNAAGEEHRKELPDIPVQTIRNWIPELPPRIERGWSGARRLLFVGRLVDSKGLPLLLEAVREGGGGVELTVCGEGPLSGKYRDQAKGLPVHFSGFAPDLAALYGQADAMVIPSLGPEGSCLVALEAMAHGLPCVMSDLPAYREIAEDGRAALLFRAGDGADLARALRELREHPEAAETRAAHARETVERLYSEDAAREAYQRVFAAERRNDAIAV